MLHTHTNSAMNKEGGGGRLNGVVLNSGLDLLIKQQIGMRDDFELVRLVGDEVIVKC